MVGATGETAEAWMVAAVAGMLSRIHAENM